MNRYKIFSPKFLVVPLFLGVAVYFGCSKDQAQLPNGTVVNSPSVLRSLFTNQLFQLDYEVETFARVTPQGPTNPRIDQLTAEPVVGKQRVSLAVNEDGAVYMEMESMTPGINLQIPGNNLPNNLETPHKSVFENGIMTLYSQSGRELYSTPAEPFPTRELVTLIKNIKKERSPELINQAILQMQSQTYRAKLDDMLAYPDQYGVTVSHLNQYATSIRIPSTNTTMNPSGSDVVLLVDRQRNLLLGSKNYTSSGAPQMCMMIRYDEGSTPSIRAIRQETMENLPSGAQALVEMVSTFANLQLTLF